MDTDDKQPHPLTLVYIALTGIAGGGFIGATTNAVCGAVSEEYFRAVLRWENIENIWRASVAQGILVGLAFGVFFSVVFSLVVGLTAKGRCSYSYALRHLLGVFIGVYCCWIVGGIIATGIAALSPEFFRATFPGVPEDYGPLIRYAWVGGSHSGTNIGGVLAAVIGSILFTVRWRRAHPELAAKKSKASDTP